MKNFQQEGIVLSLTAPAAVLSGVPVKIGVIIVVPQADAAIATTFAGVTRGVFAGMAKATGTAWAEGDKLYWDDTAKNFTKTSAANTSCGYAAAAALAGDTTGVVFLQPNA